MTQDNSNYVDKQQLYTAIVKYKTHQQEAKDAGRSPPRMPDNIGAIIILMTEKMALRKNFSGYPFIDDMKSDAIGDCVNAIEAFDPDRSFNPFGYLAITIYYAFIRRIQKEKKGLLAKYKLAESMLPDVEYKMMGSGEASPLNDILGNEYMIALVEKMENTDPKPQQVNTVWKKKGTRK